jgi:nucleoside-diphosphate kinase
MAGNMTFTIIKPTAIKNNHAGEIIAMIQKNDFHISALKLLHLTEQVAAGFYAEHVGKPFYEPLIGFMTSGPVIVAVLEKENAVAAYRNLIGPTDPEKAPEGTIRHLFGISVRENAVHGSDSDASAQREASYFFSEIERF